MGIFSRLFGKAKPIGSAETWRVGDLAECVRDRWSIRHADNIRVGDVCRVVGIECHRDIIWLRFSGRRHRWDSRAFRKIVITHEPCEAEFRELIKRPIRQPVEA